jgi:trigger factor
LKITSEKDQQSQYIVRIEIDPAELEEAKGKAAKKLSNQLRIPGFRPGKAPRALVERFVGQEGLIDQATRDLLPKAYENALKQENIKPIADPQFNVESTDPLTLIVTIPVEPTVELGDYKGIKFDLDAPEVSAEEEEKVLQQLIDQQSTWEEPDTERPAQEGDQVELDMQTVRDGETTGEPFQRTGVLGKGELLGQIDDQVQGLSVGEEKVIEVKRPEPAATPAAEAETEAEGEDAEAETAEPAQSAEGEETEAKAESDEAAEGEEAAEAAAEETAAAEPEPMTFKVKLNSIKVKHEPEVNDDFAQSVLPGVKTVDELHERIREQLKAEKLSKAKSDLTEKIVKQAVEQANVAIPPILIDAEIHQLEDNMANRLKQQKLTLDQYLQYTGKDHETLHEELRPQALDRVKTVLVLREIATQEGITVEQADFDKEIERMVEQFTKDLPEESREAQAASMREFLANEQTQQQVRDTIFSTKLTDRLIELATGVKPADEVEFADVPADSARETDAEQLLEEVTKDPETTDIPDPLPADEVETPADQGATEEK